MNLQTPLRYTIKEGGTWYQWKYGSIDMDRLAISIHWYLEGIPIHAMEFEDGIWDSVVGWRTK